MSQTQNKSRYFLKYLISFNGSGNKMMGESFSQPLSAAALPVVANLSLNLIDLDNRAGLQIGEQFQVQAKFIDVRNPSIFQSVFGGYADLIFDPKVLRVDSITYSNNFSVNKTGAINNTFGSVDEVGATLNGLAAITDTTVFTLNMTAIGLGTTAITTNVGENAGSEVALFGLDGDQRNATSFGSLNLPAISDVSSDLTAVSFDAVPDHVLKGESVFNFKIENKGGAAGAFNVNFVLSLDEVIGNSDDVVVGSRSYSGLAANTQLTDTITLKLPIATLNNWAKVDDPTGKGSGYQSTSSDYVGMVIDPLNVVQETNETNNFNRGKGIDKDDVTFFPWDVNSSNSVTASDAIFVINRLGQDTTNLSFDARADIDGNGLVTAADAISVINRLGYKRNESVIESVAPVLPTVAIAANDASAGEVVTGQTQNAGQFTLSRTGSTTAALTVAYTVSGTATNGTDYSTLSGSVTFAAGAATAVVNVNVIDDLTIEGSETVVLTLATNAAYLLGATTNATVTIADNIPAPFVTVTSPNGGESLQAGSSYNIIWSDNISENVKIDLFKGGVFAQTIFSSTLSDGNESWTLPNALISGSDYQIKVSSVNNPSLADLSNSNFTLSNTNAGLIWAKQLGTSNWDGAYGITTDGSGNIYVTGDTWGNLGGNNTGLKDAWVAKYLADGSLSWVQQLGTSTEDFSNEVAVDSLGNVYITGFTGGNLDGTSAGGVDAFLAKYTNSGTLVWKKQLGTSGYDEANDLAIDSSGNIYLSGVTDGSLGGTSAGSGDGWLAKYNSSGGLVWKQQLGTSAWDRATEIAVDGTGLYVTGETDGSLAGTNAGLRDVWLAKYDLNGGLLWKRQLGTSNSEGSFGLAIDASSNVYITGDTWGNLQGTNAGQNDVWLAKYNSSGTLVWTRQVGTDGREAAYGVAVDAAGSVYLTGDTERSLGGNNQGDFDLWVMKYDTSGTQIWKQQLGTSGYDNSRAIATDSNGNILIAGRSDGKLAGTSAGLGDAIVAKYNLSNLPSITIQATDTTVAEPSNSGQFTLTRTGSIANALTVDYTVSGTAANGTDYSNLTGYVTFAAGSATATVDVNPIDDSVYESNETVVLNLSAKNNYVVGNLNSATVTIADNELAPSITVNTPNGGESLQTGSSHNVTWSDNISENVKIDLFKGGVFAQTIFSSTLSDGSESWVVPTNLAAGSDYQIKISSVNNANLADLSNSNFTVLFNHTGLLNDINKDGKTDILWRNYNDGATHFWGMNGGAVLGDVNIPDYPDMAWHPVAMADFNNDGNLDIVWRYHWIENTGWNRVWLMNGNTRISEFDIERVADNNWHIVGSGDFNLDGNADILWRNYATGENVVWKMSGTDHVGNISIETEADLNWRIVGTGDFNGDGKSDILWRNAASGDNAIWFMNGTTVTSKSLVEKVTLDWSIKGTGDFNNDGKSDIVWRNDNGTNLVWLMNGNTHTSDLDIPDVLERNWNIVGKSDPVAIWTAEYFGNPDLAGVPTYTEGFANLTGALSKNWGTGAPPNTPADNFSARFKTQQYLAAGLYKINVGADDSVRVWIGNELVINGWADLAGNRSGYFSSAGGYSPVTVEYKEVGGAAALNYEVVKYQAFNDGPDASKEWSALVLKTNGVGTPSANYNDHVANPIGTIKLARRNDGKEGISAYWGTNSPNGDSRLPSDNFFIRAHTISYFDGGEYKFRFKADDGIQLFAYGVWGTQVDAQYITPKDQWVEAYGYKEVTYTMPAGWYTLHFQMWEGGVDALVDVSWEKTVVTPPPNPTLLTQQGSQYFKDRPSFYTTGNIFAKSYYGSSLVNNTGSTEGNCTWYAYGRVKELGGNVAALNSMNGNANQWHNQLSNGATVVSSNDVQFGDIAQWTLNGSNHVAVVEEVYIFNGVKRVKLSESHYLSNFDGGGSGTLHRIVDYTASNPTRYIRVPRN